MTPNEPNHARERIWGGGQPYYLGAAPGPADWRRWLLADAERVVRAEEAQPEESPEK